MGYTLHINGATVVADQLDEIKVLIEALRPAAPKPRARPAPDPVLDEPEEEPRFAPMYPSWDMAIAPTVGEGRNETGARTVDWAAPLEAGPRPLATPAPADPHPEGTRGPKPGRGVGGVYRTGSGKWRCRAMIAMKQVCGPSRETKAEAEEDLALAGDTSLSPEHRRDALAASARAPGPALPSPVPLGPPVVRAKPPAPATVPASTLDKAAGDALERPLRSVQDQAGERAPAPSGGDRPVAPAPAKTARSIRVKAALEVYWAKKRAARAGAPAPAPLPKPPAPAPPALLSKSERSQRMSRAMTAYWAQRHAALDAQFAAEDAARATPAPDLAREDLALYEAVLAKDDPAPTVTALPTATQGGGGWPIGRGSIFQHAGRHVLEISVGGHGNRRGTFPTRAEAEAAQETTYQARLRGEPLPEFNRSRRRCSRCKTIGHSVLKCRVAPTAPAPSYTEKPISVQVPRAPAQLPPRCHRCLRVGHEAEDCPRAAPAPTQSFRGHGAQGDPAPAVPPVSLPVLPAHETATRGDEGAGVATEDGASRSRNTPAPGELDDDPPYDGALLDDGGTDLTDPVDVPDAEPSPTTELVGGHRGWECHACGRKGHGSGSPDCPLSTAESPPATYKIAAETAPKGYVDPAGAGPSPLIPAGSLKPRKTLPPRNLSRIERADLVDYPEGIDRPLVRGDCAGEPRPCPWISCRHHLYLDVSSEGSIKLTFPHLEVWELKETCSLDMADRSGVTLQEIGEAMQVSRERIRQIETLGLKSIRALVERKKIDFELPVERGSNAAEDAT